MIPQFAQPALWSYDLEKLDLEQHKKIIIHGTLNSGTKQATDWLFKQYDKKTIREIAQNIPRGSWDKKSLALWSLILDINPQDHFIKK